MDARLVNPGGTDERKFSAFWGQPHSVRVRLYIVMLLVDVAAIGIGFALPALLMRPEAQYVPMFIVAAAMYSVIAFNAGAFSVGINDRLAVETGPAIRSLLFTYATFFLIAYFFRMDRDLSRLQLLITMFSGSILLIVFRQIMAAYVQLRLRSKLVYQLLIRDRVPAKIPDGFRHFDTESVGLRPDLRDPAMLNMFSNLIGGCERVVIACPFEERKAWAMMLKGANVRGEIVAQEIDQFGALGVSKLERAPTLLVSVGPLQLRKAIAKRAFDLALCIPALILLGPALLMVAVAIKLDSRGPVLFRQRRVGQGNAFFDILKFRSMRTEMSDASGSQSTRRDDDRITRVGYIIRRTSIDELPQLFNVLLGQMSMVGPRPHALGSLAGDRLFWDIDERYWHRHALKPGITGLAQVRGFRGATHQEEDLTGRLQADLEYISKWSVWLDLTIIVMTLKVLVHKNTY